MATDPLAPRPHMATGVRKPTESGQFEDGDQDDVSECGVPA